MAPVMARLTIADLKDLITFTETEKLDMVNRANDLLRLPDGIISAGENIVYLKSSEKRPHTVEELSTLIKCSCEYFVKNGICKHSLAYAAKKGKMTKLLSSAKKKKRSLVTMANRGKVSTTSGKKGSTGIATGQSQQNAGSKRKSGNSPGREDDSDISVKPSKQKSNKKPDDPKSNAPFVLKRKNKRITVCQGHAKNSRLHQLENPLTGCETAHDEAFCLSRYESYYYPKDNEYHLASSVRHYHLHPSCLKKVTDHASIIVPGTITFTNDLKELLYERFGQDNVKKMVNVTFRFHF